MVQTLYCWLFPFHNYFQFAFAVFCLGNTLKKSNNENNFLEWERKMVGEGVIVEIEREHCRSRKGGRGRKVATSLFPFWYSKNSQKMQRNKVNTEIRKNRWRDIILLKFRLGILKTYHLFKAMINRTVLYLIYN